MNQVLQSREKMGEIVNVSKHTVDNINHGAKSISLAKLKALSKPKYRPPLLGRKIIKSDREWWRKEIKDTPKPGAYDIPTFVDELRVKQKCYSFKTESREKRLPLILEYNKSGQQLLPGAYEKRGLTELLEKSKRTYSFKAIDREKNANIGVYDKEIKLSPTNYELVNYTIKKEPSKHAAFKCVMRRFPSHQFKPALGPGPGEYETQVVNIATPSIASFKSGTPRLSSFNNKLPGPGTYLPTYRDPDLKEIESSKGACGLFFHTMAPSNK